VAADFFTLTPDAPGPDEGSDRPDRPTSVGDESTSTLTEGQLVAATSDLADRRLVTVEDVGSDSPVGTSTRPDFQTGGSIKALFHEIHAN
jgi:hypothetical protein